MTNEQQQEYSPNELFTTYQHLAPSTLYRMLGQPHSVAQSNSLEYEDLLQCAHMGLWRACTTYKKDQSSFNTHAINHIRWAVMNGLNKSKLIKYDVNNMPDDEDIYNLIGLDNPITNEESNEDLNFHDITADDYDINQDTYNKLLLKEILPLLTNKEKEIIKLKAQDKTDQEIAEMFGVTFQAINKTINNIQDRLGKMKEEVFST